MAQILGVTNPVPGYDSNHNTPNKNIATQPGTSQIQNAPNLEQITRGDRRTDQQDASKGQQAARFDSNFQSFLQRLREMPDLAASFARLFSGKTGTVVRSGMDAGIAEELAQFLKMLQLDQAQLQKFLSSQFGEGSRFNGPFFALIRNAYQNADSAAMREDILQFLKHYNDYASSEHLEKNILEKLNQMSRAIPASFGNKLVDLIAQLQNSFAAGERAASLKLLQGQILAFMSDYIGKTHDLGKARSLLSLLALDISRYENGSEQALLQAFSQLKNYAAFGDKLSAINDQALLALLRNTQFARAQTESLFSNQLIAAARSALSGANGQEVQTNFQSLLSAFLINESVYMNLNHLIIPLEWNGKYMFSELWVDPDAEGDAGRERGQKENTFRFLFKIDIQSLGFFDIVLNCRGNELDLQINGPEKVAVFSDLIEENLSRILEDNGFQNTQVRVKRLERPLDISEVFPKLFAGKDSVNVKV